MFIQFLMIKAAPEVSKRRGVLDIIKSVATRDGIISFRTTIFHFFAPVISIGSGGTVGPEGPAAQIGGGVASKIATLLKVSDQRRRVFTTAGSGAAIAAIFNTPLGGVFFALEIILLNDYHTPTFSALILASVTASAIARIFLGNNSVFMFNVPDIGGYYYLYLFIILGLLGGILSILFLKFDFFSERIIKNKIRKVIPKWMLMIIIGLLVGVSGYFYKEIFGIGYTGINQILKSVLDWRVVLVLLLLKFFLVPLTLNSGGFGGTFAPSLFMGAALGYLFSVLMSVLFGLKLDSTTYTLVGMGAVLGGINSIPITAILMIFEMTREYSLILPLMLAVIVSSTITQIVFKGPVHLKRLERQGFKLTSAKETSILKNMIAEHYMQKNPVLIDQNVTLQEVVTSLMKSKFHRIYTVDSNKSLTGVISDKHVRNLITEFDSLKMSLIASDIADNKPAYVIKDQDLDYALKILTKGEIEELPVINNSINRNIIGVITRNDILSIYNNLSLKSDLAEGLTREISTLNESRTSKISDGYSIVERKPKYEFIGKTLKELRIRNIYGLEILMIKKYDEMFDESGLKEKIVMPGHDYIIETDDILVLFGKDENIEKTKEW